ncbi:MAG: AAA family ATPase [Myxococcota bacterium]
MSVSEWAPGSPLAPDLEGLSLAASRRIYAFGDFELDEALSELRRDGAPVELQPKPLALLFYLVRNRDRVVSKREVLDEVWADVIVSETALTSALRDVRRALGDSGSGGRLVQTLRGHGYRFTPPVAERMAGAAAAPLAGGERPVFIGRDDLLRELDAALDDARRGQGRIALLRGEPGIGKTCSAERFADMSRASGATVAQGWCYEGEGAPPFWPWRHALRALLEERGVERTAAQLGPRARDLAQIVPELRCEGSEPLTAPDPEPEEARFRLFESIGMFLTWAALDQPVVVVLDDLHHADASSLRLLGFLAHEIAQSRVLILGTYRDVQAHSHLAETVAELARHSLCRRLSLAGLGAQEIRQLVPALTGREAAPELVDLLVEKTDGNPFFIKEIVQLLPADNDADLQAPLEIPPGVREVIRGRLQGLSPTCNQALATASVIGLEFDPETLARVTGLGPGQLERELASARAAGIVSETAEGSYRFSHPLVQETVYAEQSPARRIHLHRSVGEALERAEGADPHAEPGELARHFGLGAQGGAASKAIDYAVRAGDRAMSLLACEDAEAHYARALELKAMADARERADLLLALGEARSGAGHRTDAKEAFLEAAGIARELDDGERLARAAYGFAGRIGLEASEIELIEEALAALEPGDTPLRVRLLVLLAGHLFPLGRRDRADELHAEALERAGRIGDPALRAAALDIHNFLQWGRAGPDELHVSASECLALAEEAGDQKTAAQAQLYRLRTHLQRGDLRSADAEFVALEQRVAEQRVRALEHQLPGYAAMKALLRGDFEGGEALTIEAWNVARRNERAWGMDVVFGLRLGLVRREQGRLSEILDQVRDLVERNPLPRIRCASAYVLAETGNVSGARAELDSLIAGLPSLVDEVDWVVSAALLAEASHKLDDAAAAGALYALLLPLAPWNVILGDGQAYVGSASYYLGLLAHTMGRWEDAARHFSEAIEMHEKMGALPWQAHARYAYANMLASRGRPDDGAQARELLDDAIAGASKLGMSVLSSRAADLRSQLETAGD